MAEANYRQYGDKLDHTASAAIEGGDVVQLPDGRAGVIPSALASGDTGGAQVRGVFAIAKTASIVLLAGQEVYFDHSAGTATYWASSDRDFLLGVAVADAAASDAEVKVALNERTRNIIDAHESGGSTVVVKTAGTPDLQSRGGTIEAAFSATAEAQKLDWLSKRSFPKAANWILEAVVEVQTNADADVADLNIGVANATHASDADSITESCFFHFDMGADLNLDAESDDGTTEVDATDTTKDWAVGTPIHLVIDGRDETNIKLYVNGERVLSATTFTLTAATGPLKALFHLEKSSNDSPGVVQLDRLVVRIQE